MTKLIIDQPKRLFAFGCSFTKYDWGGTWPEIIAKDLDIPLYNYGRSGAGNQYIANLISQADGFYNFNKDDLIMVSWTNVSREDRWVNGTWVTPGNIFTQGQYDENFVRNWADPLGYLFRDLATIKFVDALLKGTGCQYHFISMCDIAEQIDQNDLVATYDNRFNSQHKKLCELYKPQLEKIQKSFFTKLWNNNVYSNKILPDTEIFGSYFSDGHPTPSDHFNYLKLTFEHNFKDTTAKSVNISNRNLINFIKHISDKRKKLFAIWELGLNEKTELLNSTIIKNSESIEQIL